MALPAPTPLTLTALEGAALATAATEGGYLVESATMGTPFHPLVALGIGLIAFTGFLGYRAYKA